MIEIKFPRASKNLRNLCRNGESYLGAMADQIITTSERPAPAGKCAQTTLEARVWQWTPMRAADLSA